MSKRDEEENNTDIELDPTDIEKNITEDDSKPILTLNCVDTEDSMSCDFKKKDSHGIEYNYTVELDKNNFYIKYWDKEAKGHYWYNPLTGDSDWKNPNQQQKKQAALRTHKTTTLNLALTINQPTKQTTKKTTTPTRIHKRS